MKSSRLGVVLRLGMVAVLLMALALAGSGCVSSLNTVVERNRDADAPADGVVVVANR